MSLSDAIEEVGQPTLCRWSLIQHVCKLAGLMVKGAFKNIFGVPCVHALKNALKDREDRLDVADSCRG